MNENPGEMPSVDSSPNVASGSSVSPNPTINSNVMVESLDPSGRPMEKVPDTIPEPPQKKKTGLIISVIVAAIVVICGIVAAVVVAMNLGGKEDAVAMAMSKLMSGDAPSNVAIDGTIDILPNSADLPISRVSITLDSSLMMGSNINTSAAIVTLATEDGQNYSVEFDEVYAANGDLYFKIDGALAALEDSGLLELMTDAEPTTNCIGDESGLTNCAYTDVVDCTGDEDCVVEEEIVSPSGSSLSSGILSIVEIVDGEWIRVSTEELGTMTDGNMLNSNFSCVSDLVNDINTNSNSAIELYNKYPFYGSVSENLTVSSKANPIYKLVLDENNFTNYVNSINNAILTNDLYSCLGWEGNVNITTEDAAKMAASLPDMYVEVDDNYNFTRFYSQTEIESGAEILIDLSFTYPTNVNVSEPVEYVDFADVVQAIMMSMFDFSDVEVDENYVVIDE